MALFGMKKKPLAEQKPKSLKRKMIEEAAVGALGSISGGEYTPPPPRRRYAMDEDPTPSSTSSDSEEDKGGFGIFSRRKKKKLVPSAYGE